MKYSKEVAQQVISNIELIEQSYKVIEEVQDIILGAMGNYCKEHLKAPSLDLTNNANFDLNKGNYIAIFTVNKWCNKESNPLASYCIGYDMNKQTNEVDLEYLLSHLVGECASTSCYQIRFWLVKDELNITAYQYKKLLKETFDEIIKLQQIGFRLSDNGYDIVYEFTLDKKLVADEYPEFVDTFKPLTNALNCLLEAHPIFESIVEKMISKAEVISQNNK
ncbi:MAG: hypothetical protein HRT37_23060 [Alteromonadaceae bacterium]|nr:hypothetical protein [Alteromonadaceae bacterium]